MARAIPGICGRADTGFGFTELDALATNARWCRATATNWRYHCSATQPFIAWSRSEIQMLSAARNSIKMRVSITIPVYNEESCLADSLMRVHSFLSSRDFGWDWEIVVADNGSTDRTLEIAHELAREHDNIRVLNLDQKGRGRSQTGLAEQRS